LIEAYFMYQAFVKVFRDYGDYVMWKCAAMGWGESFEHAIDIFGISNILELLSPRVLIGLNIPRHLPTNTILDLAHRHFPALCVGSMYLPRDLIGSLDCLSAL